jgi:asparagine synthase (glutamine-hydrolysing)
MSETSFTNVFRFPNSHFLKLSLNDEKFYLKFERYYNLKFNDNLDYNFDKKMAERYSEEYYDILSSAVDLRLRADVDVGTCLSGGLDSSSLHI